MFLSRRTTQAEYFDSERPLTELQQFYRALARVNSLFLVAEPFQRYIPRLVGPEKVRHLSLLDLGAGDASLGKSLAHWATQKGWEWRVVNLDQNAAALVLNGSCLSVAGSVLALPFRDGSFDVVIASQMTHHLSDQDVLLHLSEAWRVAIQAIVISDLHRNLGLYLSLRLLFLLTRFPHSFRKDGLLSVKRGWRVSEMNALAHRAGLHGAHTSLYFGARVVLQVKKT